DGRQRGTEPETRAAGYGEASEQVAEAGAGGVGVEEVDHPVAGRADDELRSEGGDGRAESGGSGVVGIGVEDVAPQGRAEGRARRGVVLVEQDDPAGLIALG